MTGEPRTREALITLLWPESDPFRARDLDATVAELLEELEE